MQFLSITIFSAISLNYYIQCKFSQLLYSVQVLSITIFSAISHQSFFCQCNFLHAFYIHLVFSIILIVFFLLISIISVSVFCNREWQWLPNQQGGHNNSQHICYPWPSHARVYQQCSLPSDHQWKWGCWKPYHLCIRQPSRPYCEYFTFVSKPQVICLNTTQANIMCLIYQETFLMLFLITDSIKFIKLNICLKCDNLCVYVQ